MLKKIFNSIFGTRNDRLLKEYLSKVLHINRLEPERLPNRLLTTVATYVVSSSSLV